MHRKKQENPFYTVYVNMYMCVRKVSRSQAEVKQYTSKVKSTWLVRLWVCPRDGRKKCQGQVRAENVWRNGATKKTTGNNKLVSE